MTDTAPVDAALTVGQVAERFGVTVRTLHHYDEIGLVHPHRTAAGYRRYTDADLDAWLLEVGRLLREDQ